MISVIVPVYNVEEYLHVCLNSVLKQTYQNFEIICIDDASTDSSLEILEYFARKDSRVKIIKNESNKGQGFSRNKALDISKGKYIFFLDADDWLSLDSFEILEKNAEKDNLDLLMFKNIVLYQESNDFGMEDYYDMKFMKQFDSKVFNHKDLDKTKLFDIPNGPCNKLFLKSFLDDFNIRFPNERLIHEDNPFFYKCIVHARRMSYLDTYFYNRRRRPGSTVTLTNERLFDNIKIVYLILDVFMENRELYEYYKKELLNYIFVTVLYNKYNKIDENLKERFFGEVQGVYKKFIQDYGLYKDIRESVHEKALKRFNFDEIVEELLNPSPEISVIIPVYNVEKYLKECLDSICNQSFRDIEIICVNDGSTDNSLKILEEYKKSDSRISIISKENGGLSSARNTGLKYANGKYIYFIDSDDYLELTALEELHEISQKKDLDILMFKLQCFDDDTKEKFTENYYEMKFLKELVGDNVFNYKDIGNRIFDLCVTAPGSLFKSDLISKMRFPENMLFEDTVFFAEALFKAQKVFFYNKYLYYYRFRENSITSSNFKNFSDIITTSNMLMELTKKYEDFNKYKYVLYSKKLFRIKFRFLQTSEEYKEDFFNKIQQDFLKFKEEYESNNIYENISDDLKKVFDAGLNSKDYKEFEKNLN